MMSPSKAAKIEFLHRELVKLKSEVQEANNWIRKFSDLVPGILFIHDIRTNGNVFLSENGKSFLGVSERELENLGPNFLKNFVHTEDHYLLKDSLKFFSKNTNEFYHCIFRIKDKNDDWHWIYGEFRVFRNGPDGIPSQILGMVHDTNKLNEYKSRIERSAADNKFIKENLNKYNALTKREVEVLKLVLNEMTSQEIADMLHLSIKTIETHRKNIIHKLGTTNTIALVKFAIRFNII